MTSLTAAQRNGYETDGFVLLEGVCIPALDEYRRAVDDHASSDPLTVVRFGKAGVPIHCKIPQLAERDPIFRRLARDPRLVAAVEDLIGPALIFRDVVVAKPPRTGTVIHYHQDAAYWDVQQPDRVLSAWIALDDAPVEAGCLRVVPGSHKSPFRHRLTIFGRPLPHAALRALRGAVSLTGTGDNPRSAPGRALRAVKKVLLGSATRIVPALSDLNDLHIDPKEIPAESIVALPVRAGDAILFPSRLIHGSGPNTGSSARRAYIATYVARDAVPESERSRLLSARA